MCPLQALRALNPAITFWWLWIHFVAVKTFSIRIVVVFVRRTLLLLAGLWLGSVHFWGKSFFQVPGFFGAGLHGSVHFYCCQLLLVWCTSQNSSCPSLHFFFGPLGFALGIGSSFAGLLSVNLESVASGKLLKSVRIGCEDDGSFVLSWLLVSGS